MSAPDPDSISLSVPEGLSLRCDLRSGDLGRLIVLHGMEYDQWPGYGLKFEAFVARTVAEFGLENDFQGRIWLLERGDELVGCAAVALRRKLTAQLRWVVVHRDLRGGGLGQMLVRVALDYCRERGCREVFLETTDGLDASSALYRKLGFREISNQQVSLWDGTRALIRMRLDLDQ